MTDGVPVGSAQPAPAAAGSMPGANLSPTAPARPGAVSAVRCAAPGEIRGRGELLQEDRPLVFPGELSSTAAAWTADFLSEIGSVSLTVNASESVRISAHTQGAESQTLLMRTVQNAEPLQLRVPAGAYSVRVEPSTSSVAVSFELSLEASGYGPVPCEPGPGEPIDLGLIARAPIEGAGYIGVLDSSDSFRFDLQEAAQLAVSLSDVRGDARLRLYRDADPLVDDDDLEQLFASDGATASLGIALPRGTYQLLASTPTPSDPHNLYSWRASATEYPMREPSSDTGGVGDAVQQLGFLGAAGFQVGGYVGTLDERDVYRIELTQTTRLVLEFLDRASELEASLFRDGPVLGPDDAALITLRAGAVTSEPLEPGAYQVRVTTGFAGDAHQLYTLALAAAQP